MKQALDVEKLLQWAYRDELPKKGFVESSPGWDNISTHGMPIDDGSLRLPPAFGAPHPDALVVERAVAGLDKQVMVDWAESLTTLLGELAAYAPTSEWCLGASFNPQALVIMHARMGTRPPWETEPPRLVRVLMPERSQHVVVGRDANRNYLPGAHCPLRLEPSVDLIVSGRAEYAVWRAALDDVRESLSGWTLREHEVLAAAAAREPWNTGVEKTPKILRSMLAPQALPPPVVRRPRHRVRAGS